MKSVFKTIFLLCFLAKADQVHACFCTGMKQIDSLHHLDEYAFVAHVKIIDSQLIEADMNEFGREAKVTIRIIELFKGEPVRTLIEFGVNTSCAVGIQTGEEWLIFGKNFNGNISVGACTPSTRYRDVTGSRIGFFGWPTDGPFILMWPNEGLSKIKRIFGHADSRVKTGKRIDTTYNGRIEIEEHVIKGKLYGERRLWYPNGRLLLEESYINDTLNGRSSQFSATGQLIEEKFFRMGKPTNLSRIFYDTTNKFNYLLAKDDDPDYSKTTPQKIQISTEIIYDDLGQRILCRKYRMDGTLKSEEIIEPERNIKTDISYHYNGRIKEMCKSIDSNYGVCRSYDVEGNLNETWTYDERGKKKVLK